MLHGSISYRLIVSLGAVALAVLLCAVGSATNASAQTAPNLRTASSYAVLGASTVTNTGSTTIGGNLGVSPGSAVTGFPPGTMTGTRHAGDAAASQAQVDVTTAYNALTAQSCTADLTGQNLGGLTLTGGVYCFSSSAQLTGQLTLDAQGSADAVFIFQMGSTLTTASNSSVLVISSGVDCNVFWQVGSSATIGTGTTFRGNILASASITLTTGANVSGRALAQNGAVTLDTNHVGFEACAASTATVSPTASPTSASPTASPTSASPTTSAFPTASPTATAAPTGTATPTATPTAAATPTPTSTPVGQTPTPAATPVGQTPTPTPTPTATPVGQTPTPTPTPTATPVGRTPTPTPTPTATPVGQTPTPHITPCCLPRTGGPSPQGDQVAWTLLLAGLVASGLVASALLLGARARRRVAQQLGR
jgi:hypothetical protein